MRVVFRDGRLKVVGIGGPLREGSANLGGLVIQLAEKIRTGQPSRRGEPVGADA